MLGTLQALGQMMLNVFVKFPVGILVWLFWFDSTNMTTIPIVRPKMIKPPRASAKLLPVASYAAKMIHGHTIVGSYRSWRITSFRLDGTYVQYLTGEVVVGVSPDSLTNNSCTHNLSWAEPCRGPSCQVHPLKEGTDGYTWCHLFVPLTCKLLIDYIMSITSTWCVSPRISPSLQSLPPSPSLYWTMHNWHHSTALSPCWPPLKPNPRPKTQWQAVLSRGVIFSGVSGGDRVSMVDGVCAGVFAVLVILSMDSISRVVRGLLRATNWIMKSWGRKQIWRNHMSSGAKQFPRIQKLFQIEILLSVSAQRSMVVFPQHVEWDVIALRFSKTSRAWSQKHPPMASNLWDDLLGWRWSWAGLVQPGSPGSDTAATLLGNERSGNSNGENQGKPWDLRSILLSNNPISVFPWSFQS